MYHDTYRRVLLNSHQLWEFTYRGMLKLSRPEKVRTTGFTDTVRIPKAADQPSISYTIGGIGVS